MVDPETFGFSMAAQHGSVTKFVKETTAGRVVVYQTDDLAVQVNETFDEPSVAVASSGFFWRDDIGEGSLHDNERVESVSTAHQMAKEEVEGALA